MLFTAGQPRSPKLSCCSVVPNQCVIQVADKQQTCRFRRVWHAQSYIHAARLYRPCEIWWSTHPRAARGLKSKVHALPVIDCGAQATLSECIKRVVEVGKKGFLPGLQQIAFAFLRKTQAHNNAAPQDHEQRTGAAQDGRPAHLLRPGPKPFAKHVPRQQGGSRQRGAAGRRAAEGVLEERIC